MTSSICLSKDSRFLLHFSLICQISLLRVGDCSKDSQGYGVRMTSSSFPQSSTAGSSDLFSGHSCPCGSQSVICQSYYKSSPNQGNLRVLTGSCSLVHFMKAFCVLVPRDYKSGGLVCLEIVFCRLNVEFSFPCGLARSTAQMEPVVPAPGGVLPQPTTVFLFVWD